MTAARRPSMVIPFLEGALALALLFYADHRAVADLFAAWQTKEYSHGILIPLVALLLAWHRLAEVQPIARPSWLGVGYLAVSAAL
ncbi:MAG TPA: archaeosortase/exosortase family protein, partial [Alphaproteobacteria bacterium]|nr:archaeosortase/exosortase family protein [Alphaproteobacteria bacterium]